MKKSSSARRVPRKIGLDEDESNAPTDASFTSKALPCALDQSDLTSAFSLRPKLIALIASSVKRPTFKAKRPSQLRSFNADNEDDNDEASGAVTPKRASISRIAVQRSAGQRSSFLANELHRDPDRDDDVPTYSVADLQALKDSTPSTPHPAEDQSLLTDQTALDVKDKFGTNLARYEQQRSAAIPSATEIAEKKARRARLALEAKADEYISLDPDDPGWQEDDDGNVMRDMEGRLVLREKDKYKIQQSRLVRDDEDIMEGFEDYTGDSGSRIVMGASALPEDRQARRNDISAQIADAEGGSESDSDMDEKTRNHAFEAAQTRHGAYSATTTATVDPHAQYRAKTPPVITPVPDMESVLRRLRKTLMDMEEKKRTKEAEMDLLTKEKFRIRIEEDRVQTQLKEVAEKFRQLKIEKGFLPKDGVSTVAVIEPDTVEARLTEEGIETEQRPKLGLGT